MRIVTLELDPDTSSSLNRTLRLAGYHSKGHSTGDTLRRTLRAGAFDLAILDWDVEDARDSSMLDLIHQSLPFEWQVIFVISGSEDKKALESLRRPFSYSVKPMLVSSLLARVRSFLQHVWRTESINNEMQFGPYRLEPASNAVAIGGTRILLTRKEYALALLLLRSLSNPLSRVCIAEKVWSRDERINARTITTHLSMIKSKLKFSQYGYQIIPIYNYGYRLDSTASDSESLVNEVNRNPRHHHDMPQPELNHSADEYRRQLCEVNEFQNGESDRQSHPDYLPADEMCC